MRVAILVILAVICAVVVARTLAKCHRPWLAAILSVASGAAALFCANAFGAAIAINTVSAACAAILGIPGVLMMLLMGKFF